MMNIEKLEALVSPRPESVRALSLLLQFQPNTLGYFLKGSRKPTLEQLTTLAKFFKVSTDYLLDITDEKNNNLDAYKSAIDLCKYTEERLGDFYDWDERQQYINELFEFLSSETEENPANIISFAEKAYRNIKEAA